MEQALTTAQQEILQTGKCPDCGAQLYITARGGLAENLECGECQAKFWVAPLFPPKRLTAKEAK